MEELQDQLDTLKKENQDLKEENITLKRELEASKLVAKSFSDASSENLAQKRKVVTYKEVEDRNDRKLNFIIRGIRESEREDGLERREDDRKEAIRVCALTGVVEEKDVQESILSVCRLGKKDAEKKYRTLLLKISRSDVREKLVRAGCKLREINQALGTRYRIEADLMADQTAAYRALWKEADEQSGNGRRFYVTGPRENPVLRGRDMTEEELAQEGQGGRRRWRRRRQEENLGSSRHKVHVLQYRHHWKKGNRADASIGKRGR
jgi:hypothetical protein